MNLETLWYAVIAISVLMYTVLDGFDLGVGAWHLLARNDHQRRVFLNAIGPVWDGNEVWLVIIMGGLFAGFPNVYATIFSGFYTLLMFLIAGLIIRAVAIEFRSKRESTGWRSTWDVLFSISSILVAFVLGLLIANMIRGIPLDAEQNYVGDFAYFLHPYSILVGLTTVSLFAMHGATFLNMKTEGESNAVIKKWINPAIGFFLFWYIVTSVATLYYMPHMLTHFHKHLYLIIFPILSFLAILNVPYQVHKNNEGMAFLSSAVSIALLLILYGLGTYPTIVPSTIDPDINSLTIYNTASSHKTLIILLTIVVIGVPLVLAYGFFIYHIFRGKVRLEKNSY
ncbi:MAG TPA: cytochrome d ubiquinol oxidase subunit II [Chlamydiales bacterium]|nr:cytochrome d ubiquinol oxidase subunit II [Chlamydiales bacterium]